jgi:hypothetical protein
VVTEASRLEPNLGSLHDFLVDKVVTVEALRVLCAFGETPDLALRVRDLLDRLPTLGWYETTSEVLRLVSLNILAARRTESGFVYELPPDRPTTSLVSRLVVLCDCRQGRFLVLPLVARERTAPGENRSKMERGIG